MKKYWLIIAVFLLSGCTSRLAYNNLDWLVYWYMDDYVELTDSQEVIFDKKLAKWIEWHRNEQLQLYSMQLKQLRQHVQNNTLNKQTIAQQLDQAQAHLITLRNKLAPELAQLATQLSDDQVIYLFAAISKDNREKQDSLNELKALSAQARYDQISEDIEEEFEERLGSLTDTQQALIREYARHFTSTRENWLAYRVAMQNEARKLFSGRADNPAFSQQLTQLLQNPDDYRSPEYLQQRQHNRQAYLELASRVADTMTTQQKDHVEELLSELLEDIEALQEP